MTIPRNILFDEKIMECQIASMKKWTVLMLFALIVCTAPAKISAAVMFDPSLKWNSIVTEHFRVHYHQGLEAYARRTAETAEKIYPWLTRVHNWKPRLRTDLVLTDNTDLANGFAMPYPFNRVQIYTVRPPMDSELNNFVRWDQMIFTHEYTHILNMDAINGLPSCTRDTIGRFCFPGIFMPIWALEGNAVNYESLLEGRGRNNSTMTDMVLRTEYAGNRFKSITMASHYPREWPAGSVPYLYGGLFVQYLEKKYGKNSFARIFEDNSDNIIPYLVNRSARNNYDETFIHLWKEWESFLKVRYERQLSDILSKGTRIIRTITDSGYKTTLPRFSRDGGWIGFVRMDAGRKAVLMKYSLHSLKFSTLCEVNYPSSISITEKGSIFLTDVELHRSFSLYNDVYAYTGRKEKLSDGGRVHFLDTGKDGSRWVYIHHESDRYSIRFSRSHFKNPTPLLENTDIQLAFPRISPDGSKTVFCIRDRTGSVDLALYDSADNSISRLTSDSYNDITPAWHPDGERIIFTSDRDGVYNLYDYTIATAAIRRLTNVTGGAFHPDVSPDGRRIVMALYGPGGYNIALTDYPENPPRIGVGAGTPFPEDFFSAPSEEPRGPVIPKFERYSPISSIAPPLWIPLIGSTEMYEGRYDFALGFMLPGSDTLYRHFYTAMAEYFTVQQRLHVNAQYTYAGLYPDIILNYENEGIFPGDDTFPWSDRTPYALKRTLTQSGSVTFGFPIYFVRSGHYIIAGYHLEETRTDVAMPYNTGVTRHSDLLTRFGAGYVYSCALEYGYSISKEDGREISVFSDIYTRALGSDLSYFKGWAEYKEYLKGPLTNHVFAFTARGGIAENNPRYLSPFPLGRFEKGEWRTPPDDEERLGMRGYPSGTLYGDRLAVGVAEYRFPIARRDVGSGTFPLLFRNLWGLAFMEYGNVWNGSTELEDFRTSCGIELHLKLTVGYFVDITGYAGFARGFNRDGEDQIYFGFATVLEGALKGKKPLVTR